MSERQLVLALAEGGRSVSLTQLVNWRNDGLLPPLASTGVHNGRTYYWREPDILEQAQAVHDALRRHGRMEAVTIALWLAGFAVPLLRLRRAWLHRLKRRVPMAVRRVAPAPKGRVAGPGELLRRAALGAAAALAPQDGIKIAVPLLEAAAARLGLEGGAVRQACAQAFVTADALASSDLMRAASDEDMRRAQKILGVAAGFVADSGAQDRGAVIEAIGETLFLHILALLHSGQEAILDELLARIDGFRAVAARPAAGRPLYARA